MVERVACSAFAGETAFGGLAPDEGFRLDDVLQQVVVDHVRAVVDARVAAVANLLCGDLG